MSVKRFDPEDVLISTETVSVPVWSNDTDILSKDEMEVDKSQLLFYKDVYYKVPTGSSEVETDNENVDTGRTNEDNSQDRVQFSVAWGHRYGSGSEAFMDKTSSEIYETGSGHVVASPSSVIWGQYRNLVLGDEEDTFHFGYGKYRTTPIDPCNPGTGSEGDTQVTVSDATQFFAITIDRARYKEKLRPGSLVLKIGNDEYTDDSTFVESERYLDCGRVYDIVKIGEDTYDYGPSGSYGFLLPDIGVILLNGDAIDLGQDTEQHWYGTLVPDNALKLTDNLTSIRIQSEETVTSNFVFVRARNAEFNYSTNPSNIYADGELRHSIMINSPQAFITTVGLYNDNNDLLAVAKLSKPLVKDFTKEALIRIKLDY